MKRPITEIYTGQSGYPFPSSGVSFTWHGAAIADYFMGYVCQYSNAGDITHVWVRNKTVNGTPTNSYRVAIRAMAAGVPDETGPGLLANSADFTPVHTTNTHGVGQWIALSSAYTVPANTTFCVCIEAGSGTTIDGTNNAEFLKSIDGFSSGAGGMHTAWRRDTAAAALASETDQMEGVALKSDSGGITAMYGLPIVNESQQISPPGGSGNALGIKINVPATQWATYKISGFRAMTGSNTGDGAMEIEVTEGSDPTDIKYATSIDTNNWRQTTDNKVMIVAFDDPVALNGGTDYWLTIKQNPAVIALRCMEFTDSTDRQEAIFPEGRTMGFGESDGATWSEASPYDKQFPWIQISYIDVTYPTGGGGGGGSGLKTKGPFIKNKQADHFSVVMTMASDHVTPALLKTVAVQVRKDDGGWGAAAAGTGPFTEKGNGEYVGNIAASDLNTSSTSLRFYVNNDATVDERIVIIRPEEEIAEA